ncbi:hypothetical protein Tsubulata_013067 [Turnera subulata]|uniref:MYB transcription factor n=1 Tax=Turnera subulata TaxID=218843 RepID=A0A9Q0F503_9ROSI|nr:hypothetical protein Tsubulata_013067 [Turnera subulata]
MGRPPCCDKVGVKKGPWTPEEDIILVSYIQEHGPGNWRSVPTNTGFGVGLVCSLKWAAIASYLPQRTDNDIKNYWNTHLKKKLKKLQDGSCKDVFPADSQPKGQWERRLQTDIHLAKQALCEALSLDKSSPLADSSSKPATMDASYTGTTANPHQQASTYASSADNIARLLQNWMKNSPKQAQTNSETTQNSFINRAEANSSSSEGAQSATTPDQGLDSLFSFNSSHSDASQSADENAHLTPEACCSLFQDESKPSTDGTHHQVPLILLEKWLFDEGAAHGHEDLINMTLEDSSGLF